MEKYWKVTFEGESPLAEDDFELEFVDLKDMFNGYLGFQTTYFEHLVNLIESNDNYNGVKNLKSVTSPEGDEFINRPVALILAIDKNDLRYGFLLFVTDEDTIILAVWPDPFYKALKENQDLMNTALGAMIEAPQDWKRVDIVIPLTEEAQ